MPLIPVEVYTHWPTPNYVNPTSRGHGMSIVSGIFLPLSVVVVCLRVYRTKQVRQFGWDDGLIVMAAIMTDGFTIPIIIANNEYGLDRHVWDVPLGNITRLLKFGYAARISLQLAGNFTRMSLVCFYFRLVEGGHHRRFILILRAALALLVVYCVVFFFPAVFACNPIKAYWMLPPPPNATCLPEGNWAFTAGVVSCIMDVMVMILPVPIIMNLSMTLRKRVVVIVLLNLGLLATIAGVLRTYYTWRSLLRSYDTTWEGYGLWITAAIEVNTGIICACVPTLRFLFGQWFGPASSSIGYRFNEKFHRYRSKGTNDGSSESSSNRSSDSHAGHPVETVEEAAQPTIKNSRSMCSVGDGVTVVDVKSESTPSQSWMGKV